MGKQTIYHAITYHTAETGLQDFGNKWYHVQQLLLAFHVSLKQQRLQLQILQGQSIQYITLSDKHLCIFFI